MIETAKRIGRSALDDNITGEAAKATYYLFFSIFPLILAAFALTGLLGGENAFTWIMQRVETLAPGEGGDILEGFVSDITQDQRFDALSIGLLLAVWAGSNFFAALGQGLDAMFDVREDASFLKRRGKALLMLFFGGALLLAGATVILLGPTLVARLGLGDIANTLRWPLGFVLIAAQMWLMYYILPNRDQSRIKREMAIGAVVATLVWIAATGGFSLYVQNFANYNQTYGAVGAIIILMMWLFLTALAVLLGGEVAHVLEERRYGESAGEADGEDTLRLETPRQTVAPAVVAPGSAAASPRTAEAARITDEPAPRRDDARSDARRANNGGGNGSRRTKGQEGTSLALNRHAGDGNEDHRPRRQHMAVDRNEGFSANDPFASGTGEVRGGAYDRVDERSGSLRESGDSIRDRGEEMLERGKEQASAVADSGRSRIAGRMEDLGDRLEERGRNAQERGGVQERAGRAAVRAGHALDDGADYLRSHDMDEMRDDLERQIRQKPLMSVGIALGAGFLLARILRD